MAAYQEIEYTVEDPAAIITLNRPEKLNALTYTTLAEIRDAIRSATADPAVVGIIVTGNGRGFCSGLDSSALSETVARGRPQGESSNDGDVPGMFTYLLDVPKPVIAAVNGVAAGGGLVLAAMSDVRIASSAARFTTVFLKRGLIGEHGMTWTLPRLLGHGRAFDLLLTSRMVEAEEAARIGLVEYVCEPEVLLDQAREYVARIAAEASPGAIAETKRLLYRHWGQGYPESLREADDVQWDVVARPDATEGAKALLERRPPQFERLGES